MANRWVEFVRKWAKDNNMNYMCAMTTKECKEAYLKEYPKKVFLKGGLKGHYDADDGTNSTIDVEGLIEMVSALLTDLSNLGPDAWSGSKDNVIEMAKRHKLNISKYISKEDGWFGEYETLENILEGLKGKNWNQKAHFFLQDLFELLEGYRNKGEQKGMAGEDTPAPPAKKKVGRPKKVVVGDAPPKRKVGRPSKVVVDVPKKNPKKSVMGETDQQLDLLKLMMEGARKAGLPEDFAERVVLRKGRS